MEEYFQSQNVKIRINFWKINISSDFIVVFITCSTGVHLLPVTQCRSACLRVNPFTHYNYMHNSVPS
jgi:hypothetical protein